MKTPNKKKLLLLLCAYVSIMCLVFMATSHVLPKNPLKASLNHRMTRQGQLYSNQSVSSRLHRTDDEFAMRDMLQRKEAIRKYCEAHAQAHAPTATLLGASQRHFSFTPKQGLVYCAVQKVGTSFLMRLMNVLQGTLPREKLFKGTFFHSRGIRGVFSFMHKPEEEVKAMLKAYRKFMVVRDPYSRLFSAYLDKVYLPTRRMTRAARQAIRLNLSAGTLAMGARTRPQPANSLVLGVVEARAADHAERGEGGDSDLLDGDIDLDEGDLRAQMFPASTTLESRAGFKGGASRAAPQAETGRDRVGGQARGERGTLEEVSDCLVHVSFETFLRAVTSGRWPDNHWSAMHSHCRPCAVGFDYVSNMETLGRDLAFIFKEVGENATQLIGSGGVGSMESESEMVAVRDLVRSSLHAAWLQRCSAPDYFCVVMRKIWSTLKARGLVWKRLRYPFHGWSCRDLSDRSGQAVALALAAHKAGAGNRQERMRQRKEAMAEAYSRLPRDLLRKVETFVREDCEMFGYACSPDARFPVTSSGDATRNFSYFGDFW